MEAPSTTIAVQRFLDELGAADTSPSEPLVRALLARSVNRLQMLCSRLLFKSYPRLMRGPVYLETDDLLSAVVERLIKAMREVKPHSVHQFFALANKHIRWELNDLARRIDQRQLVVPLAREPAAAHLQATTTESATLLRILEAIDALPTEEREVFEYVRIQGMTHAETAELLGVAEKTIQRRLRRSVLLLTQVLQDLVPSGELAVDAAGPSQDSAIPEGRQE